MSEDRWSRWVLRRRFGGDAMAAEVGMRQLAKVRERVLDGAKIRDGDRLLDVGAGDGLIAFGALERVGERGAVVLSDISRPLLDHAREGAIQAGMPGRCEFVQATAERLPLAGESVDVVTTRSVLIYVKDKGAAFGEFHRVLKRGGRLSIFEPINRFGYDYAGRDERWECETNNGRPRLLASLSPRAALRRLRVARRVKRSGEELHQELRDFFTSLQPLESDPMMDFDEKDLLRHCEQAGFRRISMQFEARISPAKPARWEAVINSAGNPNIPTMAEAMEQIFTPEERERFEARRRPILEAGGTPLRGAVVFLVAVKDGGEPDEED